MVTATLPEHPALGKTPEDALVIRLRLNGTYSSEFFASQSEVQERLTELWNHLRPLLVYALENPR